MIPSRPYARAALCASLVCLAGLAAAPSAVATRYATPTPGGTPDCSQANPCDIVTAINSAPVSETEVILNPGHYGDPTPISTALSVNNTNMVVHPAPGSARPIISSSAATAVQLSAGARLEDVEVRGGGTGNGILVSGGALADRVIVSTATAVNACSLNGASTIQNSVCWNTRQTTNPSAAELSSTTSQTGTLRNVTAIATGPDSFGVHSQASASSITVALTASNVIARGGAVANGGGDVRTSVANATSTATATLDHSNYVTENEVGTGTKTITDPGSGTNQTASPIFVDEATGDFRQIRGSPTVDAGAGVFGTMDFERQTRTFDSGPDIGADEMVYSQRFAKPGGTGTACGAATECPVNVAINSASLNDEVILRAGTYGDSGNPVQLGLEATDPGLLIRPEAGARPELFLGATNGLTVNARNAEARDLVIRHSPGNGAAVFVQNGSIDRVFAESSSGGSGCSVIVPGTIRNSVCSNTRLTGGRAHGLHALSNVAGTIDVRNVTAVTRHAEGFGLLAEVLASSPNNITVNATNVIARNQGTPTSGRDVGASATSNSASVNLDHSNYASVFEGGTTPVTDAGSPTNQIASPSLSADFRQQSGSPTIDAGATDASKDGPSDIDGGTRTLGSSTDIGADEFVPPAASSGGSGGSAGGAAGGAGGAAGGGLGGLLAPSNVFSFGKFDPLTGVWVVNVPGPGGLVAEDAAVAKKTQASAKKRKRKRKKAALIKTLRTTATKAGPVRLKLALSRAGKARLRKRGRLAVNVRVTYTPTGGKARNVDTRVVFKARKRKKKR